MKIIAGPCMAEDLDMMQEVAQKMKSACDKLEGVDYYFKASFDKANRTSVDSQRGPGFWTGIHWLENVKKSVGCKTLTDFHEPWQIKSCLNFHSDGIDVIQIPAMLCRQTDLIVSAARTGKTINIKKGQFLSPYAMKAIAEKATKSGAKPEDVWLCERGTQFGYSDLVVDMRGLQIMGETGHPVIFDATHSTQQPPHGERMKSDAQREFAPLLARAALATGWLDGVFLEVHPEPDKAQSDGPCMLTPDEAIELIGELHAKFVR